MLDRLNELVSKKVDSEYLRTSLHQTKTEVLQQLEIVKTDLIMERQHSNNKLKDHLEKVDINSEKALDEVYTFKEQIR